MVQVGKPVTGKNFVGREKELAELVQYLKMGQSVVLVAPRRFGKTSLVLEALNQLKKQNYYTAIIDIFTNPTLELLSSAITGEVLKNHKLHKHFAAAKNSASALIKNIKLKAVLEDFQFIVDFADNTINPWELVSESIDFVDAFSKKHSTQMICAYDEFGDIDKFDTKQNLTKLFRSKMQHHSNTAYIFSGSYESVMQNMFVTSKSPFYRMAKIIHLGYIGKENLTAYFNKTAKQLELKLSDLYFEEVMTETCGHPYYSQLAFQQVVLFRALEGKVPSVSDLLLLMIDSEKDYLEKVWEDISSNREYVYTLRALAESSKSIYTRLKPKNINVSRATKNLEGMGILFKDSVQGYYLSDPLLKRWIRNNL